METIHTVFELWHIEPPWSYLLVFELDAIAIFAIGHCIREIVRARRAIETAKRATNPGAPLVDGAQLVAGTVELASDEPVAVRVTVTQEGSEYSTKSSTAHRWLEIRRETSARPFYLRHESGARIRVEPPQGVLLVDALDQKEWIERNRRRLRAELLPGERALVEGVLRRERDPEEAGASSGYRQAASQGWVMKPDRSGKMHVSTEELARRHVLRARAFGFAMAWMIVVAVLAQAPLSTYRARLFLGKDIAAVSSGKSSNERDVAHVQYDDAGGNQKLLDAPLSPEDFRKLPAEPGKIWVRHVPAWDRATALGKGSSVMWLLWAAAGILTALGATKVYATQRHRRWYEGRVDAKGKGELPIPTGERFGG